MADGKAIKEPIPVNGGRWGLAQDDWGKVWFVNAGNETGPVHFQQHIKYGQFAAPNERIGQYKVVWPIARVPDTQGGPSHCIPTTRSTISPRRPVRTSSAAIGCRRICAETCCCGPVGRLIRRTLITVEDGVTRASRGVRNAAERVQDPRDQSAIPSGQHHYRARRHSLR